MKECIKEASEETAAIVGGLLLSIIEDYNWEDTIKFARGVFGVFVAAFLLFGPLVITASLKEQPLNHVVGLVIFLASACAFGIFVLWWVLVCAKCDAAKKQLKDSSNGQ